MLGASTTCAIIDPRRDIDVYLVAAKALNMKITHILETHLHADFISGHIELAAKTGADIYAPRSGNCDFDHVALSEGDTFKIEDVVLDVLETPGHTPEHISYVVKDTNRGMEPSCTFCGDTLLLAMLGDRTFFLGKRTSWLPIYMRVYILNFFPFLITVKSTRLMALDLSVAERWVRNEAVLLAKKICITTH